LEPTPISQKAPGGNFGCKLGKPPREANPRRGKKGFPPPRGIGPGVWKLGPKISPKNCRKVGNPFGENPPLFPLGANLGDPPQEKISLWEFSHGNMGGPPPPQILGVGGHQKRGWCPLSPPG